MYHILRRSSSSSSSSSSSDDSCHHYHKGYGYCNYQPNFVSDRNRDGLITEADFVISARERGWGYEGKFKLS